ncbi:hypothetical protein HPO_17470 [Hyphomonas polymorpha PS728]|uniref:Uncharacterized protein n=1 Tax=Hyphomonas polymorpha PS728 TaxID=1280954 RepID=A0A062V4U3_9PROT|nr:hypothetical protein [Hyphomonas polymorpha]KCZ96961.1 hypothetical protein HPO_17470 [Hyphomonas polymorpha PS728]
MENFVGAYADAANTLLGRADEADNDLPGSFGARMYQTVSRVPDIIRGIASMVEYPAVELTQEANFLKVTEAVTQAEKFTTTAINQQSAIAVEWEADIVRRENAACGFERGSPDAERILTKFCAKDAAAQLQDMAQWLKDPVKGGMYLGLLERADTYATGLDPAIIQRFRRDYVALHAPKLAYEREAKAKVHEAVIAAAGLTSRVKGALSDPRRYADIRDRKAKHTAAEAAFLAALNGGAT